MKKQNKFLKTSVVGIFENKSKGKEFTTTSTITTTGHPRTD